MTSPTFAQKKWIQIIHVAKRELDLTDEAYRAVLMGAAGVESSSDIKDWKQYNAVLAAFKKTGFRVKGKSDKDAGANETDTEKARNPEWITSKQEYYIQGLWKLASRKKDEASLRRMIKRIGKVSDIRFLKRVDAQKVILALRDITKKAGYDPDTEETGRNDRRV